MEKQEKIIGLTENEVLERNEKGEKNIVQDNKVKSNWQIILSNVCTLFNLYNLLIALALTAVGAYSNLAFMLIIILNISIGTIQEIQAKNMVAKLSVLMVSKVSVIRNGVEKEIAVEEIVKDDSIVLRSGDQIPSDSIIIVGKIEVNESLLTGESESIIKNIGDEILSGSYVVSGKCHAKVVKVGADNFATTIALKGKSEKKLNSELLNSMKFVTRITSFIIIPVGIILFIQSYFYRGEELKSSVISVSASLLGMLPKGLVLLISISLAAAVIKLAKKKVLVQNLYSVETLSHVDTLCLDKTGTITEGKMKVTNVTSYKDQLLPIDFTNIMTAYVNEMDDRNGTFQALKNYYQGNYELEIDHKIQFSSERKWSSISFSDLGTIVVGAPERLIKKSKFKMTSNLVEAQQQGERVLLIGFTKEIIIDELPELEIIASIQLSDPLRKNAKEMLGFFKGQGVNVKIISGDNVLTVASIAKEAGLKEYNSYIDLSEVNDEEIPYLVEKYSIFARVSPSQKSLLVKSLQDKGHIVAMTGDGVNDVMALRQADCSITLPDASDIAKQVSQIVLLNSDFSVLKDVLMEGRRVVNNITNVARIFFIKTLYSVMLSIFNIVTFTAFPFIPVQITLVDLIIEGYTSFFISFEPNGQKIKNPFLKTVLRNAFPYSLMIMLNIMVISVLANILNIENSNMITIMYNTIGFTSFLAVTEVCRPLNKIRLFLCITTALGFLSGEILFNKILHLSMLKAEEFIILILFCILTTVILFMYKYFIRVKGDKYKFVLKM